MPPKSGKYRKLCDWADHVRRDGSTCNRGTSCYYVHPGDANWEELMREREERYGERRDSSPRRGSFGREQDRGWGQRARLPRSRTPPPRGRGSSGSPSGRSRRDDHYTDRSPPRRRQRSPTSSTRSSTPVGNRTIHRLPENTRRRDPTPERERTRSFSGRDRERTPPRVPARERDPLVASRMAAPENTVRGPPPVREPAGPPTNTATSLPALLTTTTASSSSSHPLPPTTGTPMEVVAPLKAASTPTLLTMSEEKYKRPALFGDTPSTSTSVATPAVITQPVPTPAKPSPVLPAPAMSRSPSATKVPKGAKISIAFPKPAGPATMSSPLTSPAIDKGKGKEVVPPTPMQDVEMVPKDAPAVTPPAPPVPESKPKGVSATTHLTRLRLLVDAVATRIHFLGLKSELEELKYLDNEARYERAHARSEILEDLNARYAAKEKEIKIAEETLNARVRELMGADDGTKFDWDSGDVTFQGSMETEVGGLRTEVDKLRQAFTKVRERVKPALEKIEHIQAPPAPPRAETPEEGPSRPPADKDGDTSIESDRPKKRRRVSTEGDGEQSWDTVKGDIKDLKKRLKDLSEALETAQSNFETQTAELDLKVSELAASAATSSTGSPAEPEAPTRPPLETRVDSMLEKVLDLDGLVTGVRDDMKKTQLSVLQQQNVRLEARLKQAEESRKEREAVMKNLQEMLQSVQRPTASEIAALVQEQATNIVRQEVTEALKQRAIKNKATLQEAADELGKKIGDATKKIEVEVQAVLNRIDPGPLNPDDPNYAAGRY